MNVKTSTPFFALLFVCLTSASAHAGAPWTDVQGQGLQKTTSSSLPLLPDHYRLLRLDEKAMRNNLSKKRSAQAGKLASVTLIEIPLPDGSFLTLQVTPSKTMAPELAAKYPQIKTYRVDSDMNNGIYGVLDVTTQGFHAMLFMNDGSRLFIDPRSSASEKYYISYFDKHYHPAGKKPHACNFAGHNHGKDSPVKRLKSNIQHRPGTTLRTYRLAMAATGEYTTFHGGTAGALSAITTTVNRVNAMYERDLAVHLELIANTNLLIRTDTTTYSNADGGAMLSENQTQVDNVIGSANYDIGHVVSTGGGGVAFLGSVCNSSQKAGGVTGGSSPVGDAFDIDFVAHEIGHQFGGNHTFNSTTSSCGGGNRNSSTAFEPGSGVTIMAYAGICGSDNLQSNSDAMFHVKSIEEMGAFIDNPSGGSSCGTNSSLNNQQPTSNAGSNYTIPANTPFELVGTGSDADGNTLSYSWEQVDAGQSSSASVNTGDNAIFRTFLPVSVPTRIFPKLSDILGNSSTIGELLPSSARTLNFSLAVRDNEGGVANDEMVANVATSSGFKMTSHNTSQTLTSANTVVTWDVAGTASSPISCNNVDILLSTNGGTTFTSVVAGGSTANDGSQSVTLPGSTSSTTARFKVKCTNNIFFDISDSNVTLNTAPSSSLSALSPVLSNTGGNNVVDPGETINIIIPLSNQTATNITNISGTVSSSVSGTSIPTPTSAYPNITAGSQANNTTPYQVQIPANHVCGTDFPITLTSTSTGTTPPTSTFDFTIPTGSSSTLSKSNSTAQAIPDGASGTAATITSTISISGAGTVTSPAITVDVDITHTWRGDVGIQLTSPQGTSVQLKATNNDSTDNVTGNFPTTLTPVDSLSAFDGENLDGNWTLTVGDSFAQDTGTLNSWTLNYQTFVCQAVSTDTDGDTVIDSLDNCPNMANTDQLNTDNDAEGNVCDDDDDNDGTTDVWEIQFGFDPLDSADATLDPDNDGTTNLQEFQNGTNPNVSDISPSSPSIVPVINDLLL